MTPNPLILKSVEQLGYRVTVGDIAAQAGLEINLAQQGLLALAANAGGHLQVAESGEIVYLFPQNFRTILRNKFWRLRLKEWWDKVWQVLFYLIRISFGIVLIVSIVLMVITIAVIIIAISSSRDSDSNSGGGSRSSADGGSNIFFFPHFWSPDIFWIFNPSYDSNYYQQRQRSASRSGEENQLNFLEAVFSFLFGDGNPNFDLEERRWQTIGTAIRNNGGAVAAEQIAPYLDKITAVSQEDEDYMLPVLARFNGYPEVSPQGEIIYYFPDLQVTANQRHPQSLFAYLQEKLWRFSAAGSGQILLAIGLGAANFILALVLGSLLQDDVVSQLGGLVAFVDSIYWFLLGYGTAFLGIPLIRYFWIKGKNRQLEQRNQQRQEMSKELAQADANLRQKIDYARQFAGQKVIGEQDVTYTTQRDLLEQEFEQLEQNN